MCRREKWSTASKFRTPLLVIAGFFGFYLVQWSLECSLMQSLFGLNVDLKLGVFFSSADVSDKMMPTHTDKAIDALTFLNVFNAPSPNDCTICSRNMCIVRPWPESFPFISQSLCGSLCVCVCLPLCTSLYAHANATNRNHIYLVDSLWTTHKTKKILCSIFIQPFDCLYLKWKLIFYLFA